MLMDTKEIFEKVLRKVLLPLEKRISDVELSWYCENEILVKYFCKKNLTLSDENKIFQETYSLFKMMSFPKNIELWIKFKCPPIPELPSQGHLGHIQ